MTGLPTPASGQNERNRCPGGVMKFLLVLAVIAVIVFLVLPRLRGRRGTKL